jgi:hypothetical protein
MLLPVSEIVRMTGYTRPSAQVRWLRSRGWKFDCDALGRPNVAQAEFNRRMVGGRAGGQEPNWEALNGSQAHAR